MTTKFAEASMKHDPVRGWEQINPNPKGSVRYRKAKKDAEIAWGVYNQAVDMAEEKGIAGEITEWPTGMLGRLADKAKAMDKIAGDIWEEENAKRILTVEKSGPAFTKMGRV